MNRSPMIIRLEREVRRQEIRYAIADALALVMLAAVVLAILYL